MDPLGTTLTRATEVVSPQSQVRAACGETTHTRHVMLTRILARLAHYLSTYCLHGDHEHCRRTCKTCGARCRCRCHRTELAAWQAKRDTSSAST